MHANLLPTLGVLLLLAPAALAGSPSAPEARDDAGDAADGALDLVAAWWTSDLATVRLSVQVRALSDAILADGPGEVQRILRADFASSGTPNPAWIEIHMAVVAAEGTRARTNGVSAYLAASCEAPTWLGVERCEARVDPGTGVVTADLVRDPTLRDGVALDGLVVRSYASPLPVEVQLSGTMDRSAGREMVDETERATGRFVIGRG